MARALHRPAYREVSSAREIDMNPTRRLLITSLAVSGLAGFAPTSFAKGKRAHHNGAKMVKDKLKTNGHHEIDKNGPHTVSVDVKDGKIAGFHVKHATKGELPVKKYKTKQKMARADGFQQVSYMQVQDTYLGTTYIGYSYYDDYGDEQIYWYPYDMILDGDTGAVEYVPV
jgi:hypothetical protein